MNEEGGGSSVHGGDTRKDTKLEAVKETGR